MSDYTLSYTGEEVNGLLNTVNSNHAAWDSISQVEDSIVAQGVSGNWTWRKYASGIAECWGIQRVTLSSTGNYWFSTIALPFTFHKKAGSLNEFITTVSGGAYNTTSLYPSEYYDCSEITEVKAAAVNVTSTSTETISLHWRIIGKWK